MQLFHKYYNHQIHKLFHTKFWLFETSVWLHVFGRAMISVFIPIFLLKLGYSVSGVLTFYLIYCIFNFPLNFIARYFIQKIGGRIVVIIGTISFIISFVFLYNLEFGNLLIFVLMAFFMAVYDTFYWVGHLYLFMLCSKHKANICKDTSMLYIAKMAAAVLAPLFGALILIFLERDVLIIISIIVLLLSIWPLFKIKAFKDKPSQDKTIKLRDFFTNLHEAKAHIAYGIFSFHNVAESVIWPIFIFIIFKTIESVAIIPVLIAVASIICSYFTGKIKKSSRSRIIIIASLLILLTWIFRLVLDSSVFYFVSIAFIGVFSILITLPIDSEIFEIGEKKNDPLSAATYRNFMSMFPRIFFYLFLILMIDVFKISFISAALSMLILAVFSFYVFNKPNLTQHRQKKIRRIKYSNSRN